jgi:hypothetical protein
VLGISASVREVLSVESKLGMGTFTATAESSTTRDAEIIAGGAGVGAVIGAIAGGAKGAGVGAATVEAQVPVLSWPPKVKRSAMVLKPV